MDVAEMNDAPDIGAHPWQEPCLPIVSSRAQRARPTTRRARCIRSLNAATTNVKIQAVWSAATETKARQVT